MTGFYCSLTLRFAVFALGRVRWLIGNRLHAHLWRLGVLLTWVLIGTVDPRLFRCTSFGLQPFRSKGSIWLNESCILDWIDKPISVGRTVRLEPQAGVSS